MAFAVNDFAETGLNTPVTIDFLSNDFDFDQLLTLESSSNAGGTIALNDGGTSEIFDDTLTYTPPANFRGLDQFSYTIGSTTGGTDTANITVAVDPQIFIPFNSATENSLALVEAIVSEGAKLTILPDTISFIGGFIENEFTGEVSPQTSFYNGSLPLGINAGVLLTSGDATPPLTNTEEGYSVSYEGPTDADLQAVANSAFEFAGTVEDANILEFSFTIDDPTVQSVTFDLVFASDEFPEFSNSSFVDVAAVFVNGQNVALFNNDPTQPLSVIDRNLALGNFINNESSNALPENFAGITQALPIEYDGVSSPLTIFAPVQQGTNTVKIGVGDTGDGILDSALFVANFTTSNISSNDNGVLLQVTGTNNADQLIGSANNEFFETFAGDDLVDPGLGNDIADLGAGNDTFIGGTGDNTADGGDGIDTAIYIGNFADFEITVINETTIQVGSNTDTLINFEQLQFDDQTIEIANLGENSPPPPVVEIIANTNANNLVNGFAYNSTPIAAGTQIRTTLTNDVQSLGSNAEFANLVGLYETTGLNGGIDTNGDGVADLLPGDVGYARAAIESRVTNFAIFAGASGNPSLNTAVEEFGDVLLSGGKFYAPFVIANGGSVGFEGFMTQEDAETDGVFNNAASFREDLVTYFSFVAANPDGVEHLQARGNGVFGFEDLSGGGDLDFNDAVFQLAFTNLV